MDPYARIRVGHFVYETQTDPNGGKTPRWNRVIHSQLPSGVNTVFVEVYDECSFKMDELIAWTEIKIPETVLRGETHEEWYSLSGKQGDHVEGMIDVVMSFTVRSNNFDRICLWATLIKFNCLFISKARICNAIQLCGSTAGSDGSKRFRPTFTNVCNTSNSTSSTPRNSAS